MDNLPRFTNILPSTSRSKCGEWEAEQGGQRRIEIRSRHRRDSLYGGSGGLGGLPQLPASTGFRVSAAAAPWTSERPPVPSRGPRALVLLALAAALYALNRSGAFEAAFAQIEALGAWAAPAFVLLQAASVVLMVPSAGPKLAAGALFGMGLGLPLTLIGAGLGAVAAFGLGRTVACDRVERRFAGDARFEALSKLVHERGWKVAALARELLPEVVDWRSEP